MTPRIGAPLRRHDLAILTLALCAAMVGCGTPTTEQVGPVQLDVPGDWIVDDEPQTADDVFELRRWHADEDRTRTLQVLVGCGDDPEALRQAKNDAHDVDDELDATDVEVAGLDTARRVELALTEDPLGDAPGGVRVEGLYGAGGGGLVVVELAAAEDQHDAGVVDTVLGSVAVDEEELASQCAGAS